jgi:hypothetical protein
MKHLYVVLSIVALNAAFLACSNPSGADDSNGEKAITAFAFTSPAAKGVVHEASHTVTVTVPYGTDLTALEPTITHTGARMSPASGTAQDFSSSVTYTVTAEDGSTQKYTATVTVAAASAKQITDFCIFNPYMFGTIDETAHTIRIIVPAGTDRTALETWVGYDGASVSPGYNATVDFSSPVTYTDRKSVV